MSDADGNRRKVIVLKEAIDRLNLGCEVIPIVGSILDNSVLHVLTKPI